jgi:hypothetical protein
MGAQEVGVLQRALTPVSERLTFILSSRRDLVVADLSNDEMVALCKEHLKFLRDGRDAASAHIATSQEMIEQSRALIVQIDEQINRMERELGWFGGQARRGPEPETVI